MVEVPWTIQSKFLSERASSTLISLLTYPSVYWSTLCETTLFSCWIRKVTSSRGTQAPNSSKATQEKKSSENTFQFSISQKRKRADGRTGNLRWRKRKGGFRMKAGESRKMAELFGLR